MRFRKSNLPLSYADAIYQSNNLTHTVEKILANPEIYKIIWFYKPQLIKFWEQSATKERAEAIGKIIIRMSSRTTINQLMGVMGTRYTEKKEIYSLSTEYLKQLYTDKMTEIFDSEKIQYKISNLLMEREHAYYINSYFQGSRRNLVFRKNTVLGLLIQYIAQGRNVDGKGILQFGEKHNLFRDKVKSIVGILYNTGAVITNIDIEALSFCEDGHKEGRTIILSECEARQLQELKSKTTVLAALDISQFVLEVEHIEKVANSLLGKNFLGRIINGHSRERGSYIQAEEFGLSKALKRFLSTLGANTPDYMKMKAFEESFVHEYGMFHCVPIMEILPLYQRSEKPQVNTEKQNAQMRWFKEMMVNSHIKEQDEIVLTGADLDVINGLDNGHPRTNESRFDMKYRRYGKDIVLTDIAFSFPGALFHAYLNEEEIYSENDKEEADYLYYCSAYLASIGCPKGAQTARRIRLHSWGKQELGLDAIGIMVDFDGMHVIDRKTSRKIVPVNPTMKSFQYQIENVAMEFLDKIGRYLTKIPSSVLPMESFNYSTLPRIRYKNIIIQPKKWVMRGSELKEGDIKDCLTKRKVDRYVYLMMETGEDRYLDLDSQLGKKWLKEYAFNHEFVLLSEAFHSEDYCVDRISTVKFETEKSPVCNGYYQEEIQKVKGDTPYSSWHLIYEPENLKEIKEAIVTYIQKYEKKYFFIHYVENGSQVLRLRVRNDDFESSWKFMDNLSACGLIGGFSLQNYTPETIRYGGNLYIQKFEKLFEQESEICIKLDLPRTTQEIICMQVAITLAIVLNVLGTENSWHFLQIHFGEIRERADCLTCYRKYKYVMVAQVEAACERLQKGFSSIDKQIKQYIVEIGERYDEYYADYILLSLLHMRINRMVGVSPILENQSYGLACLLYKKIINRKRGVQSELEYAGLR